MGLSLRLLGLVLLLALLAFFVASEFALIRLRPTRVQELAENGSYGALAVERLQRHLRRALGVNRRRCDNACSGDDECSGDDCGGVTLVK
jgi:CBS domain containing-hemolysin-like protein